jgi:hypothetical protein
MTTQEEEKLKQIIIGHILGLATIAIEGLEIRELDLPEEVAEKYQEFTHYQMKASKNLQEIAEIMIRREEENSE